MSQPQISNEELYLQYITLGKNRNEISKETGLTPTQIGSLLQRYGIKRYSVVKDGRSSHPLNTMWYGMLERCTNKNASNYKWYGAKGITVCDEWMTYKNFYEWATLNGWEPGLSIDRIDLSLGYSPNNCRLVTMKQQFRNRSSNVSITAGGMTMLQCEWEEYLGLPRKIISKWKLRRGLDYVVARLEDQMKSTCRSGTGR